jgi:hypothetical protein
MELSSLVGRQGMNAAAPTQSTGSAFRDADFLAIMLTEITNQDPFEPTETAKVVENMQKLQELANTQFGKFRNDMRWAQDLMGKEVSVQQEIITDAEAAQLTERGIQVGRGYNAVQGQVENFRIVGESVWVTVGGFDYPIDTVKAVLADQNAGNGGQGAGAHNLADLADSLLGRSIKTTDAGGVVREVMKSLDADGYDLILDNGKRVKFNDVTSIGL